MWNNNTFNATVRLSMLTANTTYFYKPYSETGLAVNDSVPANSLVTLKPGVYFNPSEYMVSPAGWTTSPANFRTVNITAAILNSNGRYISGLAPLEAIIYNSTGSEVGRTTLTGEGPYSGTFELNTYTPAGGYTVRITGYTDIGGEFSVITWSCANCHTVNNPSTFDPATVHPGHFDTTIINVDHEGESLTSTTQCFDCHEPRYPDWIVHPSSGACADCHKEPAYPNAALACENCHNDRTTGDSVLSQRYGQDRHMSYPCGNCHGTLTSLTTKPQCTSCHTNVPASVTGKTHTSAKTVDCGLCHNREHDIKPLALETQTCRSCHPGINHDGGNQCTSCHGIDIHNITSMGGEPV